MNLLSHSWQRTFGSRALLKFSLLCLLAVIAFVATMAIVRPWKTGAESIEAPRTSAVELRTVEPASTAEPPGIPSRPGDQQENSAVQRAGPPNPEAERLAAASAENAARAAANLAAKQ